MTDSKEIKVKMPEGSQYKYSVIGYYNDANDGKPPYISLIKGRLEDYLKTSDPNFKYVYGNIYDKKQKDEAQPQSGSYASAPVDDIDDDIDSIPF